MQSATLPQAYIEVSIAKQSLRLYKNGHLVKSYLVSTAKKGYGCEKNSEKTPLGKHVIRAKIGDNAPINSVFIGRRATGEVYSRDLAELFPQRDWILTRILWLSGKELGLNRLGEVDSMQRYIYIHGTPDTEPMGKALSHGCIRMNNEELIELFDRVEVGTEVVINRC